MSLWVPIDSLWTTIPTYLTVWKMAASLLLQPYQSCFRVRRPKPIVPFHSLPPSVQHLYAMATLAGKTYKKPKGIARPPNSWILYRRDAKNNLPPVAPGQPRRAQADVSKIISEMWKSESDHVRAHYERLAEQAKMEHKMMYPDYKFTPETKQEKGRRKAAEAAAKELKRAQKNNRNRGAPYVVPVPHHASSVAYDAHPYDPAAYYGDAGPSPPLSAAPSPISGESPPYSPFNPQQQLHPYPPQPSAISSPGSDACPPSQIPENHTSYMYGTTMPPLQAPHLGYMSVQLPHPDAFNGQPSPPQPSAHQGEVIPWTQNPSNQSQVTLPGVSADVSDTQYLLACLTNECRILGLTTRMVGAHSTAWIYNMPPRLPPVILLSSLWKGSISMRCSKTLVRRSKSLWGLRRCNSATKHRRHSTSNLPHSSVHTTSLNQMHKLHDRVRHRHRKAPHQRSLIIPLQIRRHAHHLYRWLIMTLTFTTIAYIQIRHQE